MSQDKHTPGPWELTKVPTACGSCFKIGPFPSRGARSTTYACVYVDGDYGYEPDGELAFNARLIAAAPDLLAALAEIRDDVASGVPGGEARIYELACAAIAKAAGSEP